MPQITTAALLLLSLPSGTPPDAHDAGFVYVVTLPAKEDKTLCFPQAMTKCPRSGDQVLLDQLPASRKPWLSEDRIGFVDAGKAGYLDASGKIVIPAKYDSLSISLRPFSCGLASVAVGKKKGYIDRQGRMRIPAIYDWAHDFVADMGIVSQDGKWGILDREGKFTLPLQDQRIDPLVGGIRVGDKWYWRDPKFNKPAKRGRP